jgi:glutathione peroxidase
MSFYDLSFNDTVGNTVSMQQFQGQVLLLVNTATKCGLAPQFVDLEKLHQEYKDKGLTVIGFPCNQFGDQEPETNETVVNVCQINYGVSFLLSEKIDVNGENTHPVFTYLKDNANFGILGDDIKWNFTKFLVSADGLTINRYAPTTNPMDIKEDIELFLQKI